MTASCEVHGDDMLSYLYPNFLKNPAEYDGAEQLWNHHWTELVRLLGQEQIWETPWLKTTFVDGTPCRDGNPIFSAVCPRRRLGIRIIQHEPSAHHNVLSFWTDTVEQEDGRLIGELVISCVLTRETLYQALDLLNQWVRDGTLRMFRFGHYPAIDYTHLPENFEIKFPTTSRASWQDSILAEV